MDSLLNQMVGDFYRREQQIELEQIKADPRKYRDTNLMGDNGSTYFWWSAKHRGKTHRFCYSKHRNAAGYYLTWEEVINKDGSGQRLYMRGYKLKRDAMESAEKSYDNFGNI